MRERVVTTPNPSPAKLSPKFDTDHVRKDFPILRQNVNGHPLVYLDNAATAQKPQAVIDSLTRYYTSLNANIHRGVHALSQTATEEYEASRSKIRHFIGGREDREIVFVRGTTEGINLVAYSFARPRLKPGDEILITAMEHHSNIVPWQIVCREKGATLRVVPINDAGEMEIEAFERMLSPRTKLVSVVHMSNALGTINPAREIVATAHAQGVPVMLDGAQAAPHMRLDMADLDCDFYAFSGHKLYGPTGIGVLFGKTEHLEAMEPFQGGGEQIKSVTFEETIYNDLPYKFEAGTPHIAGVIGLGVAIDYIQSVGRDAIETYEDELLTYGTERLSGIERLRLIGTAQHKASVLSFVLGDVHPHDVGTILDDRGIAIRTGHHCTQPVMERFGVPATARASLAFYNTKDEIDALVEGLDKVLELLG